MRNKIRSALVALVSRNVVGLFLSFFAMALIFSHLNAREYAPLVLAQALGVYAASLGSLGLDVVVLRSSGRLSERDLGSLYLIQCSGVAVCVIMVLLVAAARLELDPLLAATVAVSYVIRSWSTLPAARLEADMNFRTQAVSELLSQVIYIVSLWVLLSVGLGVLGVALSLCLASVCFTTRILLVRSIVPLPFGHDRVLHHIGQGLLIQFNSWIWQLRELLIPVVLRMAGAEVFLGSYGLANQVAQKLGFIRQVVWRLAVPAIAGTTSVDERKAGVTLAGKVNVLLTSIIYLGISAVVLALEDLIGGRWDGVGIALAAIATHGVLNSAFSIHCAGMVVDKRLIALAAFHILFVLIFLLTFTELAATGSTSALLISEVVAAIGYVQLIAILRKSQDGFELGFTVTAALIGVSGLVLGGLLDSPAYPMLALLIIALLGQSRVIIRESLRFALGRSKT